MPRAAVLARLLLQRQALPWAAGLLWRLLQAQPAAQALVLAGLLLQQRQPWLPQGCSRVAAMALTPEWGCCMHM